MKSYSEWKNEQVVENVVSELNFDPHLLQIMRQGGHENPQAMRLALSHQYKSSEAELDAILAQTIVPLKQFVKEHPELLNLVSTKLHKLWMNIRSGTPMDGKTGLAARRMDNLN